MTIPALPPATPSQARPAARPPRVVAAAGAAPAPDRLQLSAPRGEDAAIGLPNPESVAHVRRATRLQTLGTVGVIGGLAAIGLAIFAVHLVPWAAFAAGMGGGFATAAAGAWAFLKGTSALAGGGAL